MTKATKADIRNIKEQILLWIDEDKEKMAQLCAELVRCKTADPPGDTREAMAVAERFYGRCRTALQNHGDE